MFWLPCGVPCRGHLRHISIYLSTIPVKFCGLPFKWAITAVNGWNAVRIGPRYGGCRAKIAVCQNGKGRRLPRVNKKEKSAGGTLTCVRGSLTCVRGFFIRHVFFRAREATAHPALLAAETGPFEALTVPRLGSYHAVCGRRRKPCAYAMVDKEAQKSSGVRGSPTACPLSHRRPTCA